MAKLLEYATESPQDFRLFSHRWGLTAVCICVSLGLDVLVVLMFAKSGYVLHALSKMIGTFVLGPFSSYRLQVGVEVNPVITVFSLALMACHMVKGGGAAAVATVVGFVVWWCLACQVIVHILP